MAIGSYAGQSAIAASVVRKLDAKGVAGMKDGYWRVGIAVGHKTAVTAGISFKF
jgi:hypothetical protein